MSEVGQGGEFLNQRYPGLAKSPEATKAAKRTEERTGEIVPRDPDARIQNYLERFKEIVERNDPQAKARGIRAIKQVLVDRYVVKIEDIPESYWTAQMRVIRNKGESGDWEGFSEEKVLKIKQDHLAQIKEDQKGSIEEWIDYLASDKSAYLPDYLKYWIFAGMLRLERYEKAEKEENGNVIKQGRFPERPTGKQRSVKMFPEVNERGLRFIADAYKQQAVGNDMYWGYNKDIPQTARQVFKDTLAKKDFRALYGWTQEYLPPISEAEMRTTEGQWVTFSKSKGNNGRDVSLTLAGKGTGWCIAGLETAEGNYLNNEKDLHIYYTRDKEGNFTNPRVVIVSADDQVKEVRGIEWEENVDDYIKATNIIGDKLREFPSGEKFFEIDADTKHLTAIDRKISKKEVLTIDELRFLYELDGPIKYFGYKKDPRIQELKAKRNPKEDMPIVFSCETSQIAYSPLEIKPGIKAYVGPLEPGIFDKLASTNIEHIYTSFPEGKILRKSIEIGGKTNVQLQLELIQAGINCNNIIMSGPDFTTFPTAQILDTVRLKVQDLGFSGYPTTEEVYKRAQELGLELCPSEVGPQYRLQYSDQPLGEWFYIGMEQITDLNGDPYVFQLGRLRDGLWLNAFSARPVNKWGPKNEFVFSFRKPETQKT